MTCKTLRASAALLLPIVVAQAFGQEFQISRWTLDGGGISHATGAEFELSGTVGQPDAGTISSADGTFEVTGGFWFRTPRDDCNSDGWVDLIDYDDFEGCLSGPSVGSPSPDCICFDTDHDTDVDLSDVAKLQREFMGD